MRMRVLHSLPDGQEMRSRASEMGVAGQPLYSDVMVDLARASADCTCTDTNTQDGEMRKVWLNREDFGLFHQDITPYEYEFFRAHAGAFKRMWQEQVQFLINKYVPAILKFEISSWVAVEP